MEHHIEAGVNAGAFYGPYGPRWEHPSLIIIHSTRSGRADFTLETELNATLAWFATGNAGAHCVIAGNGDIYWTALLEHQAWGASYLNPRAFHIEVCQPTVDRPYTEEQYRGVDIAGHQIAAFAGIPLVHVYNEDEWGYIGHDETAQGMAVVKSDPGYMFDWSKVFQEEPMADYGFTNFHDSFDDFVATHGAELVGLPLHEARYSDFHEIKTELADPHMVYQVTEKGRLEAVKLDDGTWRTNFYPST